MINRLTIARLPCSEKNCGMRRIYECSTPERGDLIRYFLKGNDTPLLYNGVHVVPMGEDGPSGSVVKHSALLESLRSISCGVKRALRTLLIENSRYLDKTPESLVDEKVISFTETLVKNPFEIRKKLMSLSDKYSVRQYLQENFVSILEQMTKSLT